MRVHEYSCRPYQSFPSSACRQTVCRERLVFASSKFILNVIDGFSDWLYTFGIVRLREGGFSICLSINVFLAINIICLICISKLRENSKARPYSSICEVAMPAAGPAWNPNWWVTHQNSWHFQGLWSRFGCSQAHCFLGFRCSIWKVIHLTRLLWVLRMGCE